jgi:cytochrome c oxidase subunit IV
MEEHAQKSSQARTYLVIFIILAALTAVEIVLAGTTIVRSALNAIFISLSLLKIGLVAAFYMHLRHDSRIYLYSLLFPAAMFILFVLLTVIS